MIRSEQSGERQPFGAVFVVFGKLAGGYPGGMADDDTLCGCDLDFRDPLLITNDEDVDALVLYADVNFEDPEAVAKRQAEYDELAKIGALG